MQGDPQAGDFVKIFIRKVDKKAKSIKVAQKITAKELKQLAASKLKIPVESVILYNKGRQIIEQTILTPNTIIHTIDRRNVDQDSITIIVKGIEKDAQRINFTINSCSIIYKFILDHLESVFGQKVDDLLLVYVGKQLNTDKTFRQENVESMAELICVKFQQFRAQNRHIVAHNVQVQESEGEKYTVQNITKNNQEVNETQQINQPAYEQVRQKQQIVNQKEVEKVNAQIPAKEAVAEIQIQDIPEQVQNEENQIEVQTESIPKEVQAQDPSPEQHQPEPLETANKEDPLNKNPKPEIQEASFEPLPEQPINSLPLPTVQNTEADQQRGANPTFQQQEISMKPDNPTSPQQLSPTLLATQQQEGTPFSPTAPVDFKAMNLNHFYINPQQFISKEYRQSQKEVRQGTAPVLNEESRGSFTSKTQRSLRSDDHKLQIIAYLPEQGRQKPHSPPHGLSYEQIRIKKQSGQSSELIIYQNQVSFKDDINEYNIVSNEELSQHTEQHLQEGPDHQDVLNQEELDLPHKEIQEPTNTKEPPEQINE